MQKLKPFYRTKNKKISLDSYTPESAGAIEYFTQTLNFNRKFVLDPIKSAALHELTGNLTLQPIHMNALRVLGFELVEVPEPSIELTNKNAQEGN